MKLIIRKLWEDEYSGDGQYNLEDINGNVLAGHISSSYAWAKHDLLNCCNKPEYYEADIDFIDETVIQLYIDNQTDTGIYIDHIEPECAIVPNTRSDVNIYNRRSRLLLSSIGCIEVINDNSTVVIKTAGNIVYHLKKDKEVMNGNTFVLSIYG